METTYALNENETLQEIKRPPRIGFIKTFAGTTPPEGTLLCDGSAVSRDTYSDLFDVIGTTWGAGDGSTTFNLPDLRGKWLMGADEERGAGKEVAEGLPNITGSVTSMAANIGGAFSSGATAANSENSSVGNSFCVANLDASRSNAIYGASDHVTPASVTVLRCIVYE